VEIDKAIDQKILKLKHSDRNRNAAGVDEVYYECLIRANLDDELALEILRNKRPNLVDFIIYFCLKISFYFYFYSNHLLNQNIHEDQLRQQSIVV